MNIENKFIIEVTVNGKQMWWNGAAPFVDDINKAFICPDEKSLVKNLNRIIDSYGFVCKSIGLKITT